MEESCFTGFLRFDGSVVGDIFNRSGHKHFQMAMKIFYNKPVDNLLTFEWQHSVGDFEKIIKHGLAGVKKEIEKSQLAHEEDEAALEFLESQTDFCNAVIKRAHIGSQKAFEMANRTTNPEYKNNLMALSEGLKRVPESPAQSFYEQYCVFIFVILTYRTVLDLLTGIFIPIIRKIWNKGY